MFFKQLSLPGRSAATWINDNEFNLFPSKLCFNLGSCVVPLLVGKLPASSDYIMGATVVFLANSLRENQSAEFLIAQLFKKFKEIHIAPEQICFLRLFGGDRHSLNTPGINPVAQNNIQITKDVLSGYGKTPVLPSLTGKSLTADIRLAGHLIRMSVLRQGNASRLEHTIDLRTLFLI